MGGKRVSRRKQVSRKAGKKYYTDINNYCKAHWPDMRKAAERAIQFEPDPDKKAVMEDELADLAVDIAGHFMATGYNFPLSVADFEKLLKDAHQDVEKQKQLQKIFDKSIQMAGQAIHITQKVVTFLGKYGKYLALV
jgi:hypothetical protein